MTQDPSIAGANALARAVTFSLVLSLAACSSSGDSSANAANDRPAVEVAMALAQQRPFIDTVEGFGSITGDSRYTQTLTLPQAGHVVSVAMTAGHRVGKGQTLLALVTDPNARNAYQQAANTLAQARDELARTRRLHAEKLATNSALDSAIKAAADAKAALAAQAKLGGAESRTELVAPKDGILVALDVKLGERVAAGARLAEFTPQGTLGAQVGVTPPQAARIQTDTSVRLQPVYGGSEATLHGRVTVVADAINPQTHLVDVLVVLDKPSDRQLVVGTPLSARIDVAHYTAWAVPRDAVLDDDEGRYVYQAVNGKAQRVDVKVRSPEGDPVGVEGHLDPHAPVIGLGAYELADGDAVRAQSGDPGK